MDEVKLELKKFDLTTMDVNAKVICIGRPGTGKSTLIKDLLYQNRKRLPCGIVMSGTEEANDFYSSMVPESYIYGSYDAEAVDRLVARQKKMKRLKMPNPNAFLILDDCMDDRSWVKHTSTKGIFMNGRHWALMFIMAMQYMLDIPPSLRTCVDYVFLLKENIRSNKEKLWKSYAGIFPTFEMFDKVMDSCTENYECMVIKNRFTGGPPSNKIEDVVFWYKAKIHAPFKLGGPSFWKLHKAVYNEKYLEDEEDQLLNNANINVKEKRVADGIKKRYISTKKNQPDLVIHKQD